MDCADITQIEFRSHSFDLWHDRAAFHFLTGAEQRSAYVQRVTSAVKPGGHIIVSTFGKAVECPANFVPVRKIRNWHERSWYGTRQEVST
jgi:Methyltransferase domain